MTETDSAMGGCGMRCRRPFAGAGELVASAGLWARMPLCAYGLTRTFSAVRSSIAL